MSIHKKFTYDRKKEQRKAEEFNRQLHAQTPREPKPTTQSAPTANGYWWTRPASDCLWRVVEISIVEGRTYIEEMGADSHDLLPACPWWQWVGPIAPPPK